MKVKVKQVHADIKDSAHHHYVTVDDGYQVVGHTVHTNARGDGLWIDGKQVEGTAQFSVRGIKDVAGKLRRYFIAR